MAKRYVRLDLAGRFVMACRPSATEARGRDFFELCEAFGAIRWRLTCCRQVPSHLMTVSSDSSIVDGLLPSRRFRVGTHLPELGVEAERLAALLLAQPAVARHVRRIACVLTKLAPGKLNAEVLWAYQRPEAQA